MSKIEDLENFRLKSIEIINAFKRNIKSSQNTLPNEPLENWFFLNTKYYWDTECKDFKTDLITIKSNIKQIVLIEDNKKIIPRIKFDIDDLYNRIGEIGKLINIEEQRGNRSRGFIATLFDMIESLYAYTNKLMGVELNSNEFELGDEGETDLTSSTIEDWLEPFNSNMSDSDFKILTNALKHYFDKGTFPKLKKSILIIKKPAKKKVGWALYQIFKNIKNKNENLPFEYLLFANKNISIFMEYDIDKNNFVNTNLYRLFTQNPTKNK